MLQGSLFLLFFSTSSQNGLGLGLGHEKRDCSTLIGLVIIGLKRFFFFFFTLSPPVWCEGMTKSMWAGIGTLDYTWRA